MVTDASTVTWSQAALDQFGEMVRAARNLMIYRSPDGAMEILDSIVLTMLNVQRLGLAIHAEEPVVASQDLFVEADALVEHLQGRTAFLSRGVTLIGYSDRLGLTVGIHLARDGRLSTHS